MGYNHGKQFKQSTLYTPVLLQLQYSILIREFAVFKKAKNGGGKEEFAQA